MKRVLGAALILVGLVSLYLVFNKPEVAPPIEEVLETPGPTHEVIGKSVQGREIDAYTYGDGETHLLFVGGIHGGYELNSVLLAYEFKDYLDADISLVPEGLTVTVIPSLNPDGVYKVVGKEGRFSLAEIPAGVATALGRFNANAVDLNRNFDCEWKPQSTWRNAPVKTGTEPFSEPEARAIRDFVLANDISAAVFWHSQANTVYGSECLDGVLPETREIMNLYAKAAGYGAVAEFDAYEVNGDAEGWLASIGIPAITVELKTHETVEWEENLLGIKALFNYYNSKGL